MIVFPAKVAAARAAAGLSRRAGAGGGTSLPGKLLLRMAPDAIPRLSRRIAGGTVVVSATNGKTTTAKMLAAMLEPERRLCRNAAGANLASGVASALLACRERRSGRVRGRRGRARGRGAGAGAAGARAREPVPRPARPLRRARDGRGPLAEDLGRRPVAARPKRRRPARGGAAGGTTDRSRTGSTIRASPCRASPTPPTRSGAASAASGCATTRCISGTSAPGRAPRAGTRGPRSTCRRPASRSTASTGPASRFGRRSASGGCACLSPASTTSTTRSRPSRWPAPSVTSRSSGWRRASRRSGLRSAGSSACRSTGTRPCSSCRRTRRARTRSSARSRTTPRPSASSSR